MCGLISLNKKSVSLMLIHHAKIKFMESPFTDLKAKFGAIVEGIKEKHSIHLEDDHLEDIVLGTVQRRIETLLMEALSEWNIIDLCKLVAELNTYREKSSEEEKDEA